MDDQIPPQEPQQPAPPPPPAGSTPAPGAATPPPPPFLTPPPIINPQPAPTPRKGGGWKPVTVVIVVVLGVLLFGILSYLPRFLAPGSGRTPAYDRGNRLEEVYLEHRNTPDKIAVIDVQGIITGRDLDGSGMGMVALIAEQLKVAAKDTDVKAVILKVDSPGGEVLAADEINRAIIKYQDKTSKPVVASMGSVAASGGYYVSAPCRWIVANELTITGSIGVIMHGYNYRGLMNKVGVRPQVFKSGKFKDMLSGDREMDPEKLSPEDREVRVEEEKMVQGLIDETYARFKEVVRTGRESANKADPETQELAKDWEDYADGRVFSGKQAKQLGFVDELGNFEVAVNRAKSLAGISKASLIQYREPFNLGSLFGLFGKTQTPAIKVDLGFDMPRLQAGHLYYISPTVLN